MIQITPTNARVELMDKLGYTKNFRISFIPMIQVGIKLGVLKMFVANFLFELVKHRLMNEPPEAE